MNDLELITKMCRIAHYKGWEEADLEDAIQRLSNLTHEELFHLRCSRWMNEKSPLYPKLFELLYKDKLNVLVNALNEMSTEELITEIKGCRNGYKKDKIAQILSNRYDSMTEEERKSAYHLLLKRNLLPPTEN